MNKFTGFVIASLFCVMSFNASASLLFFEVNLDGMQQVPPNDSLGFGSVLLTFDDATNFLVITSGFYEDLLSDITASHIHQAPSGINGPVIITLMHTGGISGELSGGGELTGDQVTSLFNHGLYINVHSVDFPGGEIRGKITLIPAPGALTLLVVAGLIGKRRRRNN